MSRSELLSPRSAAPEGRGQTLLGRRFSGGWHATEGLLGLREGIAKRPECGDRLIGGGELAAGGPDGDAADLRAQVHDEALGGLLPHTRRLGQRRGVTGGDRRGDVRRPRDREDRERGTRADARDTDDQLEQRQLLA